MAKKTLDQAEADLALRFAALQYARAHDAFMEALDKDGVAAKEAGESMRAVEKLRNAATHYARTN